jgi:hypothetical protein
MGYISYIGPSLIKVDIKGKEIASVNIREDNQGAIALMKNPYFHERLKHIDIYYYYIQDLVKRERIFISYIPINEIIVNGFIKPLQVTAFTRFVRYLGINTSKQVRD